MADKRMEEIVLHQLETYVSRKQRVTALRYELECLDGISRDKGKGGPSDTEPLSGKASREAAESGSQRTREEVLAEYLPNKQAVERLEHHVSLLTKREQKVLYLRYRDHKKVSDIAAEMEISVRTVSYIRKQAVNRLCEMYSIVFQPRGSPAN